MPTRRRFLKFGLAGTLILATAGFARRQTAHRPACGTEPMTVLRAPDREVLGAIVPAMLVGVGRDGAQAVIGSVDRAVAGLPPHLQKELERLFALLGSAPGRRWIAGVRAPWPQAPPEEVARFLTAWRYSRWSLLQQGYHALHELVFAARYALADSWPAIGYPGPPEVR